MWKCKKCGHRNDNALIRCEKCKAYHEISDEEIRKKLKTKALFILAVGLIMIVMGTVGVFSLFQGKNQLLQETSFELPIIDEYSPEPTPTPMPTSTPTPTPTPAPTSVSSKVPVVTKNPRDEVVAAGGSCVFHAMQDATADFAVWHFVSPDALQDIDYITAEKTFPGLVILKIGRAHV